MTRRFTLIQGGLSDAEAGNERPAAAPIHTVAEAWRVDLQPARTVDAEAVAAWRALLARNGVVDPLSDPDYLLTAARHRAGGRRIAFALAWDRSGAHPVLRGVLPLAIAHPLVRRDQAYPWQPQGMSAPALFDAGRDAEILTAIRTRLACLDRPLELAGAAPANPGPPAPMHRVRSVPAGSVLGIRPEGYVAPSVAHIREPGEIRDAVEAFLALDARTAEHPIIADPSEASMVRVVTRLFARRRQATVELASRSGIVVSGAVHLGSGPAAVAWRSAASV